MKQYLKLLKQIKLKGTLKPPARENMPSTLSLFGYQFRHDLKEGFPMITTKKLSFKNIVVELLWFLKGDTNIKYLIDNGCNIWNEDAYNYYKKVLEKQGMYSMTFEGFTDALKNNFTLEQLKSVHGGVPRKYNLGSCGKQYGTLWRNWEGIDQLKNLIEGLKNNPTSRRHIITAWNPKTLDDMALNACHCLVQFNCRPIVYTNTHPLIIKADIRPSEVADYIKKNNLQKYYLDCQMYQRSADVFLGVPYNIASYALLTHIIAKMVNMVPGKFIHTFGDVHIYDNHMAQVDEQLKRYPKPLPSLLFEDDFRYIVSKLVGEISLDTIIKEMKPDWFSLKNYNPHSRIKAKLSTGLK